MRIFVSLAAAALLSAVATIAAAQPACKGLDPEACAAADCQWVKGYVKKNGKEVASHCRNKPQCAAPAVVAPAAEPSVEGEATPAPTDATEPAADAAPMCPIGCKPDLDAIESEATGEPVSTEPEAVPEEAPTEEVPAPEPAPAPEGGL